MLDINNLSISLIGSFAFRWYEKQEESARRERNRYVIQSCASYKSQVISNFQEWLGKSVNKTDKLISPKDIIVENAIAFIEYNSVPQIMGTPLYDDFKNSQICQVNLTVSIKTDKGPIKINDVPVRYQNYLTSDGMSYMSSSGYDIEQATTKILEEYYLHNL